MPHATLRFYAELNDFLPPEDRDRSVARPFCVRSSIKALIEVAGVPYTEVDLLLVNGESVDFAYGVRDGDRISVYPRRADSSPGRMVTENGMRKILSRVILSFLVIAVAGLQLYAQEARVSVDVSALGPQVGERGAGLRSSRSAR